VLLEGVPAPASRRHRADHRRSRPCGRGALERPPPTCASATCRSEERPRPVERRDLRLGSVDRRFGTDLVAGASLIYQDARTSGYGASLRTDAEGYAVSPYFAARLSPHWVIDGALAYGRTRADMTLDVLRGRYTSELIAGSVSAHGQYDLGPFAVRPVLSASLARIDNGGYRLSGTVAGQQIAVDLPGVDGTNGFVAASAEFNRVLRLGGSALAMPYAELGVQYAYVRPDDGRILDGNFQLVASSPWYPTARAGVRLFVSRAVLLEAGAAYLSLGESGLDIWEGKLYASVRF
jgi:hypothetical protein